MTLRFRNQIAAEYGFDRKTMYNRLTKHGIDIPRGLVSPADQKRIYECLGYPEGVDEMAFRRIGWDGDDLERK